jgi:uncharacterized membrane protein
MRARIIVGGTSVIILLIAVAVTAVMSLRQIAGEAVSIKEDSVPGLSQSSTVNIGLAEGFIRVILAGEAPNNEEREAFLKQLDGIVANNNEAFDAYARRVCSRSRLQLRRWTKLSSPTLRAPRKARVPPRNSTPSHSHCGKPLGSCWDWSGRRIRPQSADRPKAALSTRRELGMVDRRAFQGAMGRQSERKPWPSQRPNPSTAATVTPDRQKAAGRPVAVWTRNVLVNRRNPSGAAASPPPEKR